MPYPRTQSLGNLVLPLGLAPRGRTLKFGVLIRTHVLLFLVAIVSCIWHYFTMFHECPGWGKTWKNQNPKYIDWEMTKKTHPGCSWMFIYSLTMLPFSKPCVSCNLVHHFSLTRATWLSLLLLTLVCILCPAHSKQVFAVAFAEQFQSPPLPQPKCISVSLLLASAGQALVSPTPTICYSFVLYLQPPVCLFPAMPLWPCFSFKSRLESFHHIASPPTPWLRFMALVRPSCRGLWQPLLFPTSDSLLFLRSFKSLMLSL